MFIKIDPQITNHFPDLSVGVVIAKGINNKFKVSATQQLLDGMCAQIQKKHTKDDLVGDDRLQVWRNAYKSFGANPKKYPCAVEALMKRVVKGDSIPSISTLVDVYNYFSLKNVLPFGGEDLDQVCGDVELTYAKGNEPFVSLGTTKLEYVPKGEIVYKDDAGVTCRRWNYRECDRTKFTKDTENACVLIENLGIMGEQELNELLEETKSFIERYCGGEVTVGILSASNPEIETGIKGQTGISDDPDTVEIEESRERVEKSSGVGEDVEGKKVEVKPITTATTWDSLIKRDIEKAVKALYPGEALKIEVSYPRDASHGDYASNVALQLADKLGKNPREVAEKLVDELGKVAGVEKVEVAGPGFLNFFLSETTLNNEITKIIQKRGAYGESLAGEGKTVIVEYSSPNIAKPLAAHHLPTTVIGQAIHNLYKSIGYYAVGINHIGDWGTQFGKLTYAYKEWGDKQKIEEEGIQGLLDLYIKFHEEAEEKPELEDKAREEFKKLEEGDEENREIWHWFIDVTMKEIKPVYEKLGVKFDETIGESFYEDKMGVILDQGKENGVFVKGEKGAWVVEFEDEHVPTCVVQKSDGATLYLTRDLATVKYRVDRWQPERMIYVVDVAQSLHFKQVFDTSRRLNLAEGVELKHVDFGRMSLPEGGMSTRKGNVIFMVDVLKEAERRALEVLKEKSPELDEEEMQEIAEKVGVAAVKYNILSQNRNTNITFVWDRMLSFEGNSAPYLQYTTARAHSILRKSQQAEDDKKEVKEEEENKDEIALKRMFPKFTEVILDAAVNYKPNTLTNYLYELAKQFNAFYNNSHVLGVAEETKERRLQLVKASLQILENGLGILGIEALKKM